MKTLDETDILEQELWRMLAEARSLSLRGHVESAESLYGQALERTETLFGSGSKQCANVLFWTAAFYTHQQKPKSAQHHFQKMREIMRW